MEKNIVIKPVPRKIEKRENKLHVQIVELILNELYQQLKKLKIISVLGLVRQHIITRIKPMEQEDQSWKNG